MASQFEHDLRESLRRTDPPAGFAQRVLAQTQSSKRRRASWNWLAVAALVIVLIGSGAVYREYQRRVEGEKAKEQLMMALRVTGSKLRLIQQRISENQQRTIELPIEQ